MLLLWCSPFRRQWFNCILEDRSSTISSCFGCVYMWLTSTSTLMHLLSKESRIVWSGNREMERSLFSLSHLVRIVRIVRYHASPLYILLQSAGVILLAHRHLLNEIWAKSYLPILPTGRAKGHNTIRNVHYASPLEQHLIPVMVGLSVVFWCNSIRSFHC